MKKLALYLLCLFMVCGLVACGNSEDKDSNEFSVKIVNSTSDDIYGIGYSYYENENLISSGGVRNADNSAIKNGDEFSLESIPDADEFDMELSVVDKNGKEYPCSARISIDVGSKEPYTIQITGDFENGFRIIQLKDDTKEF